MKHLKNFNEYEGQESLNENFDFGKVKELVQKQIKNFQGNIEELKRELQPYNGKSYSEIKNMIDSKASIVKEQSYSDPENMDTTKKRELEKRYMSAGARFDKTTKGRILNFCKKLFGYGALSTIITTIAGSYMSFYWDFDPKYIGWGVIISGISLILYALTRIVYNVSAPEEYFSKGTNADYSARGTHQPF